MTKGINTSRLWSGFKRVNIMIFCVTLPCAFMSMLLFLRVSQLLPNIILTFIALLFLFIICQIILIYSWVFFAGLYDKKTMSQIEQKDTVSLKSLILSSICTSSIFSLIINSPLSVFSNIIKPPQETSFEGENVYIVFISRVASLCFYFFLCYILGRKGIIKAKQGNQNDDT